MLRNFVENQETLIYMYFFLIILIILLRFYVRSVSTINFTCRTKNMRALCAAIIRSFIEKSNSKTTLLDKYITNVSLKYFLTFYLLKN